MSRPSLASNTLERNLNRESSVAMTAWTENGWGGFKIDSNRALTAFINSFANLDTVTSPQRTVEVTFEYIPLRGIEVDKTS